MDDSIRSPVWGFVDGAISVSGSMLLAVLVNACDSCGGIWLIGLLKGLSDKDAGLIVVATLLLFPTAVVTYGGLRMWFAAKEAVEKKAMERGRERGLEQGREQGLEQGREQGREQGLEQGREQGREQGHQEERERVRRSMKERGMPDDEIAQILADKPAPAPPPPARPYRRHSRRRNGNGR